MSRPPAKLGGSAPPPGMGFPDPHTTKNNRPAPKIEEALAKSTGAANGFDAQLDLAMRQNTPDSLSFAWRLVHWMLSRNLPPTGLILSLLLKKTAGCNWVELLYDATTLLRTKYLPLRPADLDEVVLNAILDAYSRLSQRMTSPGDGETALGHMELLFQDMKEGKFGVLPGVVSYGIVIKALGATKQLERVLALWDELRSERQLQPSVVTYGCVLDALAKAATPQSMRIAEQIFDEMSVAQKNTESMSKNCVLYSTMIKGFARLSDLEKCKQLYEKMVKRDHITPNVVCMNLLLQVAVAHRNLQLAEHYFSAMRNFGFYPDFSSYLTLLRGYLFCGSASGGSTSFIAGAATSNDVLPSSDREVVRALELLKDGLQFAKLSVEAGVLLKLIKLLLDCKRTDEVRDVLKLWAQGNVCKVSVPPAAGKLIFTHVLTNAAPLVACTVRSTLKSLQILSEVQLADVERSFYKTPDPEMWTALLAEHGAAELQVYDLVSPMTCTSAAAFSCTATPMSCLTQTSAAGKGGGGRKKGGKREFFPNAGAPLRFGSVIGREPPSVAPPFDGDVTSKSCSEVSAYYASSKGGKRGKSSKGKKGKSCLPVLSKEEAIRLMTVFPGGTSSGQHRLGAGLSAAEGCSEVDGFHFSDSACSTSRTASAGNFCLSHTVSLTDELRDATAGESMVPPKIALPPPELPPVMGHLQAKTTIKNTHCNIRVDKGNNGFVDTSAKNDNTADICVAGDSGFHADGGNNSYRGRSRSNSMEGDLFFSTSLVGENESFHEAEDEEIPFAECETEELQGLYQVPYGGDLLDELYSPTEVVTSATNKGAATFLPATSNDGSANEDLGNIAEEAGAGCGTTTVRRIREDEEHDVSAGRPTASFSVATGLLPSPLDPPSDYRGFYNGGLKNENRGVPRPRPTPLALEFSEEKVPKTAEKEHNKSAAEETETPEKFWQQVRAEQLQLEKQNAGDSGSTVLQQKENKTLAGNNESKSTVAVAEETVPGTPPPSNSSERRRSQDSLNANAVPFVPQHSPLRVPVPKRPTKVSPPPPPPPPPPASVAQQQAAAVAALLTSPQLLAQAAQHHAHMTASAQKRSSVPPPPPPPLLHLLRGAGPPAGVPFGSPLAPPALGPHPAVLGRSPGAVLGPHPLAVAMGATPPPPMPPHLYGPPIASPLLLHPQHHHHPGLAVPRPPLPVRRPSLSPSPPHNTVIYQPDVMRGHHTTNNAAANQFGIHPPVGPPAAAMFEPEQLHDRPCSRSSVLGTTTLVVPPPPPSGVAPVYNNYGENIINLSRHDPAAAHNFIADRRRSSPDQLSSNGSGGNVNNDSDVQWDCDEQVSGEEPHFFRDAKHFFQESSEALARSPQRPPPQKDCINELSEVIMATWRKRNRKFLKKHGHEPEFRSLPSANTTKTHAELVSSLQSFPLFAPDADTTPFSPTDGTAGGTKKEVSEEVLKRAADFDAIEQETESWFEQHYCAAWTPRFLQRQQTRAEFVDKDGWVRADCCCSTNEGSPESGEDKTGSEGKFGSEERTTSCSVVEVDIQIEVENNVKEPVESSSIVAEKNSSIEKQEAGKKEPEMTFAKIVKKKKPAAISTNAKMNFPPLGVSVTKTGGDRLFLPEPEQPGITASVSLTDAKELPVPQRPKNSPSSTKSQPTKLSWADKMKLSNLPSPNRKRANSGRPKAAGIKPPALA